MSPDDLLETPDDSLILVMGITGSGKSHFVNVLKPGSAIESSGLQSCTQKCQLVQTEINDGAASVSILDTPGFDDTRRAHGEVLSEISTYLCSRYRLGIPLKGIIYLHRISDPRMQGSSLQFFEMFQKICGEHAFGNVALVTTMWDKISDPAELELCRARDWELRRDFWSSMEAKGAYIAPFDGKQETAKGIITILSGREPVVLELEKQVQDQGRRLDETDAGNFLVEDLETRLAQSSARIKQLEIRIAKAEADNDRQRMQFLEDQRLREGAECEMGEEQREKLKAEIASEVEEKIRAEKGRFGLRSALKMFARITGPVVSIVGILLPALGVI